MGDEDIVVGGAQPVDEGGLSASDVEFISRLEAYGLPGLAAEVAQRLEDRTAADSHDFVRRDGGWSRDEAVATDQGDRGHRTGEVLPLYGQRVVTADV